MNILGIIAEFNPFHNGHLYFIKKAKEISKADYVIVILSGDFVQRGEPAIFDKYLRAKMAYDNGADVVIELPVLSATASAEGFAFGAVSLLNSLGCVTHLAFGAENENLDLFERIADFLVNEPDSFKELIRSNCKGDFSYPIARAKALQAVFSDIDKNIFNDIISSPNCILGIEYIKSLIRLKSTIVPIIIKRKGVNYHDTQFNGSFASANSIRINLYSKNISDDLRYVMPDNCVDLISSYQRGMIINEDIYPQLLSRLILLDKISLLSFSDCNEFIANKIANKIFEVTDYNSFINNLYSKDYTQSRIKRVLIHILLNIDDNYFSTNGYMDYSSKYARVIGFRKDKNELLSILYYSSSIPIIVKLASQYDKLEACEKKLLNLDIYSSHLYESIVSEKNHVKPLNEFSRKIF